MKRVFVMVVCAAAATSQAFAADMTDALVIEAPEAFISGDTSGLYVAGRIAAAFADDTEFGLTVVPTTIINEYEDVSAVGSFAVGYDFGGTFSAELEIGYTEQDIEAHTLDALPATLSGDDAFGTTSITYGLVNLHGRYDTGTAFNPFLSAGIGMANVDFEAHGVTLAGAVGPLGPGDVTAMDDTDTGFAYQIGGGLMVDFTDKIAFELGYRYFNVTDIELEAVDGTASEIEISQHQALFGVRYKF